MQTAATRILITGLILWTTAFQTPAAPTETPVETPSATPTPTATAGPPETPTILPGLLPNVRLVKTGATLEYDSSDDCCMAASPLTGDLYFLTDQPSTNHFLFKIYDADGYRQKDSFTIDSRKLIADGMECISGMVIDRQGDLYVCAKTSSHQECWILRLPFGEREFQVFYKIENVKFIPYVSLLPIEEGPVPPGVPGPGMLFSINFVTEEEQRTAGIYHIDTSASTPVAKRLTVLPIEANRYQSLNLVVGPQNQIYIMDRHYIYRLESDGTLTEMLGRETHFKVTSLLRDYAYDAFNECFYFVVTNVLYRVSKDFQQVLAVSVSNYPFHIRRLKYSTKTNDFLVAREDGVFILESSPPYPTPTNTPTSRPPISTFRPTAYPTDPAGNPIALVPYADLRLVAQTHPDIRSVAVHPITNDLYYNYYERLSKTWSGESQWYLTVRGPIQTGGGFSPMLQQPVFGRYRTSYPDAERLVVASDELLLMPDRQTARLQKGDLKDYLLVWADELLYVGPDCHFLDVPQGSVLFFKCLTSNGQKHAIFGYFDPTEEDPIVRDLDIPPASVEQMYGGRSFHWGPQGKLHFLTNSLNRFEPDGSIACVRKDLYVSFVYYLSKDKAFYFGSYRSSNLTNSYLCRMPEGGSDYQFVLSLNNSPSFFKCASVDGSKLYLANKTDCKIWEFEPHFTPGVPVATPTPTPPPGTPTPTPTPMDWMMLDGFGGIHVSRPEIQKPVLPYFENFDIARDLEPDPLGRGWYMLDGYGGIHLSSPDLPRPDGLPYFWQDDIARDLEIIEKDGELTFVILDGYGRLYVVGPNAADVSMDVPLFGSNMARDLEPAPTGDGWLVMDAYGALFDSRDHSVSIAAGTYWLDAWFARDLSVFPNGATLMVDSYGGRHYAEGQSPLSRLYPIPSELYFMGWEIVWDFEYIR